jgi:hypothetical protein
MTWDRALKLADEQIAEWKRTGVGPGTAEVALHDQEPQRWHRIREQLAAHIMQHREDWEE